MHKDILLQSHDRGLLYLKYIFTSIGLMVKSFNIKTAVKPEKAKSEQDISDIANEYFAYLPTVLKIITSPSFYCLTSQTAIKPARNFSL